MMKNEPREKKKGFKSANRDPHMRHFVPTEVKLVVSWEVHVDD